MLKHWGALLLATTLVAATPIPTAKPLQLPQSEDAKAASSNHNADTNARGTKGATASKQNAVKAKKKASPTASQKPHNWFEGWTLSDKIAALASGLAFFQFLALIGTIFVMDRSDKRQLRAYMNVMGATWDDIRREVRITVRNCGQTPAFNVAYYVGADFSVGDLVKPTGEAVYGPGAELYLRPSLRLRTKDDGNNPTLYAFGIIKYRDAFGADRETNFQLWTPLVGDGMMAQSPKGNSAT